LPRWRPAVLTADLSHYATPLKAVALAAVPGLTDSVVVSADNPTNSTIALYDSGVPRGTILSPYLLISPQEDFYSLQVDGTLNEVHDALPGIYAVYTYNSSGLTVKSYFNPGSTLVNGPDDRVQLSAGNASIPTTALLSTRKPGYWSTPSAPPQTSPPRPRSDTTLDWPSSSTLQYSIPPC
jgi:hypothetical protein